MIVAILGMLFIVKPIVYGASLVLNARTHVYAEAAKIPENNPAKEVIIVGLIFLNEKVRKYQIIAMIVAILGMLFIVKPEFSSTVLKRQLKIMKNKKQ
jgi:hypothetical protein